MPDNELYLSLVGFSPRIGWDLNVGVRPPIVLRFNQPLNLAQVQSDALLNQLVILVRMSDDGATPVTYSSWEAGTRTLTIAPSGDLTAGETYQITLRKELQTAQGRQMITDRTWVFQVSAAALGPVVLLAPGDATAFTSSPPLTWSGVWIPSGTVSYDVQVNNHWHFPAAPVWTTTVTVSGSGGVQGVGIGVALAGQAAYYWRVRARTGSLSGEWIPTYSFWLGTSTQASPDTVELYQPQAAFSLIELLPPNGTSNVPYFPSIIATFTQAVAATSVSSGTVQLWSMPADQLAATAPVLEPTTINRVGNQLLIAPTNALQQNTRYTIKLFTGLLSVSGDALPAEVVQYFTGPFHPLYGAILTTRSELGSFVDQVSDDEIIWRLWRASLYIHELLVTRVHRVRQRVQFSELVTYTPPIVTWGMHRYAELSAACDLLDSHYFDLLQEAGRTTALAVFQQSVDVASLKELRERLLLLEQQRDHLAAEFLFEVVVPRAGIKSGNWFTHPTRFPPARDWSYSKRRGF